MTLLVWRFPDSTGSSDAAAASEHLDLLLELPLILPASMRIADDAAPVQLMVGSGCVSGFCCAPRKDATNAPVSKFNASRNGQSHCVWLWILLKQYTGRPQLPVAVSGAPLTCTCMIFHLCACATVVRLWSYCPPVSARRR